MLDAPCVAVVGTRNPTRYGERMTTVLVTELVRAGACVVSGLAFGIDACAHRAALKAGGRTVAVLGTGIDVVYPPRHRALYDEIAEQGLVLSEFGPRTPAFRGCFPRRNRIIAGLCSVTVVIEAGEKSGALITANYATDYNRTVVALPGPIDSPQSYGPNRLIRDGAQVMTCVDDVLALANLRTSQPGPAPALSGDEAEVWDIIAVDGVTTDDVVTRTGWDASRCIVAISNLEVHGLVECLLTGEVRRV